MRKKLKLTLILILEKEIRMWVNKTKLLKAINMKKLENLSLVRKKFPHLQAQTFQTLGQLNKRVLLELNQFLQKIRKTLNPSI